MSEKKRRAERRAALRAMAAAERELEDVLAGVARRLRERLIEDPSLDAREVVAEELRRAVRPRVRIVRRTAADVARRGRAAHLAEAEGVLGPGTVSMIEGIPWDNPAAAIARGTLADSYLPLATSFVEVDLEITQKIVAELAEARRVGEGALEAARRLTRVAGSELERLAPQYIEELTEAVRKAPNRSAVKAITRRFRRRMLRRGVGGGEAVAGTPFSVRGASRRLLAQLERGAKEDIGAAVNRWVADRAVRRARLISRTEGARAFREGYMRTAANNPHVLALKYNLSRSHPEADICDVMAGMDAHGWGPGVYPQSDFPNIPQHPACICFPTSVQRTPDGRGLPEGQPTTDAQEWVAKQPESKRREILGPTRARAFERGLRDDVISPGGTIHPAARARSALSGS